ncbi:MAG TPA: ABC transporter permease [Candidatus Acidoferrales bacterium]
MLHDLVYSIRMLAKNPAFTLVAVVTLALGIGAGTAIFSVVDAVFLRGLPFDEHDRLAAVLEEDPQRFFPSGSTTAQTYLDWRREQKSFEGLAAAEGARFRLRNERGEPDDAWSQRVSWEFFPTLRVMPVLGRTFTPEDEIWGGHKQVILSYGFWQRYFGGARDVIGATLQLNEEPWEIVGVLPQDFSYPAASDLSAQLFVPLAFTSRQTSRETAGRNYNLAVIGRFKPGVALGQAHQQMNALAAALDAQYPTWSPGARARVVPLHEHWVGRMRGWMLLLLGAVALVQLIACANLANLMLARAATRAREMAVRAALGASRGRLIRSLLVEAVVLALAGAGIGIVLAHDGVEVLRAWLPPNLPRVAAIAIDLRVLSVAIATAVTTGIIFGIVPAIQGSRPNLVESLKQGSRSATASAAGQRLRNAVVVAEVALAVVLLVGAGLFLGSFARLMRIDPGFDYRNLLTVNVGVPFRGDFEEARARGGPYAQQMLEAVSRVPGVESAAAVTGGLPLTGSWARSPVTLPGKGKLAGEGRDWTDNSVDKRAVSPGYLETLRIPLRRGRTLNQHDRAGTEPVAVVNEAAARRYWPGEEAIGQRIGIDGKEYTVVGVVGDIRHLGPETPPRQEAYLALAQEPSTGVNLVMRTPGDPLKVLPAVKAAIWAVNSEQRLTSQTVTLEGYMDRLIAQRRFNMAILGLLGALGLVIAAAGIYGVMAYVVAERTNEFGVRMALGATPGIILGMVLRRASALVAAGVAIGGTVAWSLSATVRAFLFQIEPTDAGVFAAAVGVLALTGLLASVAPARRAARVEPMQALRHD